MALLKSDIDTETGEVSMISEPQLGLIRRVIYDSSHLKEALRFFYRAVYPRRIFQMTKSEASKLIDKLL